MGWHQWRRLIQLYLRPFRRLMYALAPALFVTIGLQVVTPQLVRLFIDRAIGGGGRGLGGLAALYATAVVLQQVFGVLSAWLAELLGWLCTNELRVDLLNHCLGLDPAFFETHPPGELIERIDGDVNGISVFFGQFLLNVVGSGLLLLGVLTVAWMQSRLAGLVLTGFALGALAVLVAVRRVAAGAWGHSREASASLFGFLEERLAGTEDVRSSAAEAYTLAGFYQRARDRLWRTSHARVLDAIPWSTNGAVAAASNAVAFAIPAVLVQRGSLSLGAAFALYFYTQLLMQPLDNVSRQVEQIQLAIAGGRRVVELLGISPELVDGDGADLPSGPLPVAFRDVSFGYGRDPDVLHRVTFDVAPGEVLGVVGRTGSGKSSLARLLVRFHDPRVGSVAVGGVDTRVPRREQLRARVRLVSQDVHVVRASIRDNLTLFDRTLSDDQVLHAVHTLGLGSWLAALPAGLDSMVREGGVGLSAGEAQLLAFGRAFLANPSVVVLDEASSRLDPATELALEAAVDVLLRGRTGIVIAHRLATLERCDTICVLDGGQIVEYGPRAELAADPGSRFGALLRTGLDVVA